MSDSIFNTTPKDTTYVSNRLGAGGHLVTIRDIKYGVSSTDKPYMRIIVTGGKTVSEYHDYEGVNTNEQATSFDLYLTEAAWNNATAQVLLRLAEKTNNQKYLSLGNLGNDAQELVSILKPLFINTQFTLSLTGVAKYTLKKDKSDYYRNVYAEFDAYLSKGLPTPHAIEAAEAAQRVHDYWEKYYIPVKDAGQPPLPEIVEEYEEVEENGSNKW
jgi:hypothetical protein